MVCGRFGDGFEIDFDGLVMVFDGSGMVLNGFWWSVDGFWRDWSALEARLELWRPWRLPQTRTLRMSQAIYSILGAQGREEQWSWGRSVALGPLDLRPLRTKSKT